MFFPRDLEKEIEDSYEDKQLHIKTEEAKKNSHHLARKVETERDNINQQKWVNWFAAAYSHSHLPAEKMGILFVRRGS
jgi:hypothetical protein